MPPDDTMVDHLTRSELFRKEVAKPAVAFPLMTEPPRIIDHAAAVKAIKFAIPAKKDAMPERAARAMIEAWRDLMKKHFPCEPLPESYDALTQREKEFALTIARAAIDAASKED